MFLLVLLVVLALVLPPHAPSHGSQVGAGLPPRQGCLGASVAVLWKGAGVLGLDALNLEVPSFKLHDVL